jgi:DNA-binding CsgD family transcriptional regulator
MAGSGRRVRAPGRADGENDVVEAIYDAALQPQRWGAALQLAGRELRAESAFLFSSHSETEPNAVLHAHNQPHEMLDQFAGRWRGEDLWALAAARSGRMRRGTLVVGSELVPRHALLRTAFYNEFCRPHGIEAMLGSVLFDGSEPDRMPFTNLCWYRPPGQPEFEPADKQQVSQLVNHFQRALRIQRQLHSIDACDNPASAGLQSLNIASILLDGNLDVLQCNEEGARLLGAPRDAASYRFGRLRSLGTQCAPELAQALAQCRGGTPVQIAVRLASPAPGVVAANLIALRPDQHTCVGSFATERYLLLVQLPRRDPGHVAERVAELFGLSSAEVRVLALLLDGAAAGEIAEQTGTRLPTVRTHIRSIFGKTGVKRQIDLVRLLSSMRG